jgi:hypothetical protein
VTRDLVFAATQTFESTFTVNDLMERMANGAVLDKPERQRVRSSVAGAMMALLERGEGDQSRRRMGEAPGNLETGGGEW